MLGLQKIIDLSMSINLSNVEPDLIKSTDEYPLEVIPGEFHEQQVYITDPAMIHDISKLNYGRISRDKSMDKIEQQDLKRHIIEMATTFYRYNNKHLRDNVRKPSVTTVSKYFGIARQTFDDHLKGFHKNSVIFGAASKPLLESNEILLFKAMLSIAHNNEFPLPNMDDDLKYYIERFLNRKKLALNETETVDELLDKLNNATTISPSDPHNDPFTLLSAYSIIHDGILIKTSDLNDHTFNSKLRNTFNALNYIKRLAKNNNVMKNRNNSNVNSGSSSNNKVVSKRTITRIRQKLGISQKKRKLLINEKLHPTINNNNNDNNNRENRNCNDEDDQVKNKEWLRSNILFNQSLTEYDDRIWNCDEILIKVGEIGDRYRSPKKLKSKISTNNNNNNDNNNTKNASLLHIEEQERRKQPFNIPGGHGTQIQNPEDDRRSNGSKIETKESRQNNDEKRNRNENENYFHKSFQSNNNTDNISESVIDTLLRTEDNRGNNDNGSYSLDGIDTVSSSRIPHDLDHIGHQTVNPVDLGDHSKFAHQIHYNFDDTEKNQPSAKDGNDGEEEDEEQSTGGMREDSNLQDTTTTTTTTNNNNNTVMISIADDEFSLLYTVGIDGSILKPNIILNSEYDNRTNGRDSIISQIKYNRMKDDWIITIPSKEDEEERNKIEIFSKYIIECFHKQTAKFLQSKGLDYHSTRRLLIINSEIIPFQMDFLRVLNELNIDLLIIPSYSSTMLQPLDFGILNFFKSELRKLNRQWYSGSLVIPKMYKDEHVDDHTTNNNEAQNNYFLNHDYEHNNNHGYTIHQNLNNSISDDHQRKKAKDSNTDDMTLTDQIEIIYYLQNSLSKRIKNIHDIVRNGFGRVMINVGLNHGKLMQFIYNCEENIRLKELDNGATALPGNEMSGRIRRSNIDITPPHTAEERRQDEHHHIKFNDDNNDDDDEEEEEEQEEETLYHKESQRYSHKIDDDHEHNHTNNHFTVPMSNHPNNHHTTTNTNHNENGNEHEAMLTNSANTEDDLRLANIVRENISDATMTSVFFEPLLPVPDLEGNQSHHDFTNSDNANNNDTNNNSNNNNTNNSHGMD
ncbi:uncharacterized protein NDAI_0C03300 [Naumovozyma dairenensis CBS 421]|uniref:DDE-1 domain-containing protein n=1 Tax=Naumovozyma dairenensis (strain ATCC 10597 / BCRC 20456 / CBS 421 / NBRC 0211 / NRRL Y-12639) TaxID=1071378 RepID=G0W879_NAUDC|nr:hypothetical protein NDAI_0C03300 [Naumovozyma dairenensis CBS 421]CCD23990.1 hypothetical protein NDAI_0C03300 [Naumovozyma dairenensis CBS 421]